MMDVRHDRGAARRAGVTAGTLALLGVLAGCQSATLDPLAGGGGLAGDWKPVQGNYAAKFDNGKFSTIAGDTGNVQSEGSYTVVSANEVKLAWKSRVTGNENAATCQRPDTDTLDCSDSGGLKFTLKRNAAAS